MEGKRTLETENRNREMKTEHNRYGHLILTDLYKPMNFRPGRCKRFQINKSDKVFSRNASYEGFTYSFCRAKFFLDGLEANGSGTVSDSSMKRGGVWQKEEPQDLESSNMTFPSQPHADSRMEMEGNTDLLGQT